MSTPPSPNDPYRAGNPPPAPPPPPYGQAPAGQQPAYGQPPPGYGTTAQAPPNYLVWAILTTLFCFLPLGIVSIVYASQVSSKFSAGDVAGAQKASEKAKQFAIWAAIAGAAIFVLVMIAAAAGGGSDT